MKKQLVRADNVDDFICREGREQGHFILSDGMILTPGAKDELRRRNVPVAKAPLLPAQGALQAAGKVSADAADLENLVRSLADALQHECGVRDPEELKAMTIQALKTIKANI